MLFRRSLPHRPARRTAKTPGQNFLLMSTAVIIAIVVVFLVAIAARKRRNR
jgi:hypothetical protein